MSYEAHIEERAADLDGVYGNFDVEWALPPRSSFLVPLPRDPLTPIRRHLTATRARPSKLFFTGHRGSGKSTQVRRLVDELADGKLGVVPFYLDVSQTLDPQTVEYTDILLAIFVTLLETWRSPKGDPTRLNLGYDQEVPDSLLKELDRWGRGIAEGVLPRDTEVGDQNLSASVLRLVGMLKQAAETAINIRRRVEQEVDSLYNLINQTVAQIEAQSERRVLVVIDGLDRPAMEQATGLFQQHGDKLMQPQCSILFVVGVTFPYLVTSIDIHSRTYRIENVPVWQDPGLRTQMDLSPGGALPFFRTLLSKRMDPALATPAAVESMARLSAGVVWYMVAVVQRAASAALDRGAQVIDLQDVDMVARSLTYQFGQQLTYQLGARSQDAIEACRGYLSEPRTQVHNPLVADLLHLQMLVEYPDSPRYIGVHPAMLPLLGEPARSM